MKRSSHVPAKYLGIIAAATLVGCSQGTYPTEVRRCVDPQNRLLPEYECEQPRRSGVGMIGYPRYIYGGQVQGNSVMGFRSTPTDGARVVTPSGSVVRAGTPSRGGFGAGSSGRSSFGG